MKRVFTRALLVMVMAGTAVTVAFGQIPRTISFQGVLADAQGNLLPDNTYTLTLSIYDQASGGTALFSESQPVQVFRGVFNAIIGSTSPSGLPTGLDFNSPYWLGVQVNNGAELSPRTAFTAVPYALNAATAQFAVQADWADSAGYATRAGLADRAFLADTAVDVRGGFVVSINGQQGPVELLGAGATTITRNGNQFVFRSTDTSGGGIQRIDNFDGSLVIDPPQGPFVTAFIRAEGVQTYHLADMAITTEKIADQAITNAKLAPNSVTSDKIMDLTILEQDLADSSVTSVKIRDLNVWTQDINDLAVTNGKIAPDAVTTDKILNLTILEEDLADNSVSTAKIRDLNVWTQDINDLAVTNPKIAPDAITTDKILDGQVMTADIANLAVTNPKIATDAITTDKILDGQVMTGDIANLAVTNAKVAADAITTDKILNGQVMTADIADLNVTNGKLAANSVTTDKIADGHVMTADIADLNVTNGKLAANAVTTDKIADGHVMTADIADLNVTNGKLAANAVTTDKIADLTILTQDLGNNQVTRAKIGTEGAPAGTFLRSDGTATPIWSADGSALTNLNASQLTSGVVPDGRLQGEYSNELYFTNPWNFFNGYHMGSFDGYHYGDGYYLYNLNADNLWWGTVPDGRISGTYSQSVSFTNPSNSFTGTFAGNGAGLTNLNASNISSGTLADARLSSNVALKNAANTFTQLNTFNNGVVVNRSVSGANALNVFTDYNASGGAQSVFHWTDAGFGDIGTVIGGKRYGAAFDWLRSYNGATNLFWIHSEWTPTEWYTAFDVTTDYATFDAKVTFNDLVTINSTLTATAFAGNGAGLTNLNASQLTSGILPSDRLSGNYFSRVTIANPMNVFEGATFSGNGAWLTALNADNIATGTLDLARIDAATAAEGDALVYSGGLVHWGSMATSALTMPFSQSANVATTMFALTNTGTGLAASFTSAGNGIDVTAGSTGVAFSAQRGRFVGSDTVQAGGSTLAAGWMVVEIADNLTPGSKPLLTLPASGAGSEVGRIVWIGTADPNGADVTDGTLTWGLPPDECRVFIKLSSGWKVGANP